ncbi:MAG TPA: hypothetical protein VF422_03605 [Dokdonella sp.]
MRITWIHFVAPFVLAWPFPLPQATAQSVEGFESADIGVSLEILEYSVTADTIENLVRLTATNHGPASVASFVVGTCLAEPWPIDVVDTFPGGCNSYGLVVPCFEFGLGFRFEGLGPGEVTQCLARTTGRLPPLPVGLRLGVGHLVGTDGEFMVDPNPENDSIELNPIGGPPGSVPVPGPSLLSLLGLACVIAYVARRRLHRAPGPD